MVVFTMLVPVGYCINMTIQLFTVKPEETITQCRSLDTLYWGSVVGGIKGIKKVMPRRVDKVVGADLFLSLYHWNPQYKEDDSPDIALTEYMKRLVDTPQFKKLRSKTIGDKYRAAAGAVRLFRELMRKNKSDLKSLLEAKNAGDMAQAMSPQSSSIVERDIKQAQEGMGKYIKGTPYTNSPDRMESHKYGQLNYTEAGGVQQALDNVDADMDAAQELSDFHAPGKGYSLDPDSRGARIFDTLMDDSLVEKISSQDKLRNILKIAGRMRMILEGARSKKPQRSPSSSNIKFGNELELTLPSELVYLADDDLEDLFYLRYHEASLQVRDMKDKIQQGQGPFIGCVDVSGSMKGQNEEYALALFTSMARMAIRKKRDVVFMPFASNVDNGMKISNASELIQAFTNSYKGLGNGTVFTKPLDNSIKWIRESKQFKKADILFITDGISRLEDMWVGKFADTKRELECRLFGFNIGGTWPSNMVKLFDATSSMGRSGELSKLEWLDRISERLV